MEDDRCWWVAHSGLVATERHTFRLQNAGRVSALRDDSVNVNESMQLAGFINRALKCEKRDSYRLAIFELEQFRQFVAA